MNIYVLKRRKTEAIDYDEAAGFVVLAPDPPHARRLAAERAGDERQGAWLTAARTSCELIGETNRKLPSQVILRDLKAG